MGRNELFAEKYNGLCSLWVVRKEWSCDCESWINIEVSFGMRTANRNSDDVVWCGSKNTLGTLGCLPTNIFIASDKNYFKGTSRGPAALCSHLNDSSHKKVLYWPLKTWASD